MYVKHSQLELNYSDKDKIWRYMNFDKFASLIGEESLFFCRADKFGDKWEGVFPVRMIQKFELDKIQIPSMDGNSYTHCEWQIQKEGPSHLINCWHVNNDESLEMWKIYTKNKHPSIAIQSTISRLKNSFCATSERVWIGEVEYIDFRKWKPKNRFFNVSTPNILKSFFLKRHCFKYENEVRAIINKAYSKYKSKIGILVKIDLNKLIECIYLSPNTDQEGKKQISNLLKEHNYSFPINRSRLYM